MAPRLHYERTVLEAETRILEVGADRTEAAVHPGQQGISAFASEVIARWGVTVREGGFDESSRATVRESGIAAI